MNTWSIINLPKGKSVVDSKWIFRTKEDGTKKARIAARGFQEPNNFEINYSPVARLSTIRFLLIQSIQKGWKVRQLDIPTAFLNSEIDTEIYMEIPKGMKYEKGKVLKLNKGLYGLRISPKCWNKKFNQFIVKIGLQRSNNDFCVYFGREVWCVIFVDDILITGEEEETNRVINELKSEFKAKDLGEPNNFLGIEITRQGDRMKLS